jgi:hypothetical protein
MIIVPSFSFVWNQSWITVVWSIEILDNDVMKVDWAISNLGTADFHLFIKYDLIIDAVVIFHVYNTQKLFYTFYEDS